MATEQPLRAEVRELRAAVVGLTELLDAKVDEKVTEVTIPRKELDRRLRRSGQRVALGLVAVVAVAALLVGLNRTTLQLAQRQAEDDLRRLVQVCRTTTPTVSPDDLAFCERRVPGFTQARKRTADLAATATRTERRLRHLEAEVERLQRRR